MKVAISSILRGVVHEIEGKPILVARQIVVDKILPSKIKAEDKKKMINTVSNCQSFEDLQKYLWNALLKYETGGHHAEILKDEK